MEREVIGLYDGDNCLLVSRPWCAAASTPILLATERRLYPLLAALINVADFHVHRSIWFGEIAIGWDSLAAIANLNRDTVGAHLKELMQKGYIHYDPADGRVKSTLVRVFPYNTKTGARLFQVEPSWLPGFITQVVPRAPLYEITASDKTTRFQQVGTRKTFSEMDALIMSAQVTIVSHNVPTGLGGCGDEPKIDEFVKRFKDVPGFDYIYRTHGGVDFDLAKSKISTTSQPHRDDVGAKPADWRADGFSQGGVEVRIVAAVDALGYEIKATDLGVAPSWEAAGDPAPTPAHTEPPSAAGTQSDPAAASGPGAQPPSAAGTYGLPTLPKEAILPGGSHDTGFPTVPAALGGGESAGSGAGPAAPPPAPPPSASAQFATRQAERQLKQSQVDALYSLRGDRVSNVQRKRMTSREISCIETYERLSGVPFCARDLAFLNQCLSFTSHAMVLRAIRDCSRYPANNPGQYLHRDGMSHVWNLVKANKHLHAKPKSSRRAAAKPGASRSSGLAQKINDRRAPEAFKSKASVPADGATVPSKDAVVSPEPGIVSEKVAPVSPEPKEQAA